MSTQNLVENLKTLVAALEEEYKEPSKLVQGPALQVNDMSEKFGELFSPAAAEALKTRFKTVIFPRPVTKTLFLSAIAKSEAGIAKAAASIANDVNLIASLGHLKGCLAPLSTLKLANRWYTKDGQYCGCRINGEDSFHNDKACVVEKPEGAVLEPATTAVFCFITVPYEFEPSEWYGQLMDLYKQEGEVGGMLFE